MEVYRPLQGCADGVAIGLNPIAVNPNKSVGTDPAIWIVCLKWRRMKLDQAISIVMLFYDPSAVLHDDHICVQRPPHSLAQCSHGASEVSVRRLTQRATVCPTHCLSVCATVGLSSRLILPALRIQRPDDGN
jgi:hypothetical protein